MLFETLQARIKGNYVKKIIFTFCTSLLLSSCGGDSNDNEQTDIIKDEVFVNSMNLFRWGPYVEGVLKEERNESEKIRLNRSNRVYCNYTKNNFIQWSKNTWENKGIDFRNKLEPNGPGSFISGASFTKDVFEIIKEEYVKIHRDNLINYCQDKFN